ncbi:MAG: ribonuclease III domain-containing protein [Promethearchaeota archaeon]
MFEREKEKLKEFQKIIKYKFNNEKLLRQALTTPLLGNETGRSHYDEILETLGDSVIKTIFILKKYEEKIHDPGLITKTKQAIENDNTLSFIASNYFHLENYIFKAEKQILEGTSILADVLEAICGAIFLDSDLNISLVEEKIVNIFYKDWDLIIKNTTIFFKNMLLEYIQKKKRFTPKIIFEYEKLEFHNTVMWKANSLKIYSPKNVLIYNLPENLKSGLCKSKREAEQELSKIVLNYLKKNNL